MNVRTLRNDDGAILIIAIIVVTTVALVVGAVLTRGDGSVRATVALRQVAGTTYAADGAARIAINGLRTGYNSGDAEPAGWAFNNATGTGCFGYNSAGSTEDDVQLPGFYPAPKSSGLGATSAYVECTAEDATGAQGSAVPINVANKPGNAILTLGSGGEAGLTFKTNGSNGAFRVRGGVWSNSNIVRENNGTLESTESIRAHSGCSPTSAMQAPVVDCSSGTVPDPNYASDLDLAGAPVPDLRTPPSGCGSGSVTLQPGYYDDATKLNALTPNGSSNCFIHFTPGSYYFDFHNSSSGYTMAGDSAHVWNVNSGTIVGGTLTSDTTVPGRCVNPIDDVTAQGVQLVFGGDSRIVVDKGAVMELCASYHANRPPIAVYGQKTGTATQTVVGGANALTTSGTPTVTAAGAEGTFVGATAAALQDAGGGSATWFRPAGGANNVSRTISMSGFTPSSTIPKGSVLTEARLVVRHKSAQNNSGTASTILLTPTGGTALTPVDLVRPGTLTTQTVDLRPDHSSVFNALRQQVHDNGYTGAKVDFTATIAKNLGAAATAELDAARLELTYYAPSLRGQTTAAIPGNTVATPGGEPVLKALGNTTLVYIQGTTYTPLASLDLQLNNISESVFRFGVIARSLRIFETASFSYPGAVIELPDNSPGWGFNGTIAQLKVYLCPGASTCDATGELSLIARVQLWDPTGTPVAKQRQVTVLSWSHQR